MDEQLAYVIDAPPTWSPHPTPTLGWGAYPLPVTTRFRAQELVGLNSAFAADHRVVQHATLNLSPSNVSRLTKVVRAWDHALASDSADVPIFAHHGGAPRPLRSFGEFIFAAEHRLLSRRDGRLRTWVGTWWERAYEVLEHRAATGELLALLRKVALALRLLRAAHPAGESDRPPNHLDELQNATVPHAPPAVPHHRRPTAEVGPG